LDVGDRDLDFWLRPRHVGGSVEVMVKPEAQLDFLKSLTDRGMKYQIMMNDVQEAIDWETANHERIVAENKLKGVGFALNQYHSTDEIYAWYSELAAGHADVSVKTVGKTHEGRDLKFLSIGSGGKPVQFFDCLIHAREWIAGSVCLWFVNELVQGSSKSAQQLRQNFDFKFIIPANPDGYEYSRTSDRRWRNRRRNDGGSYGVDPNRNFDINHCADPGSWVPETETYCGPSPFSEPLTAAIRDEFIASNNIAFAYSFHSYSEYLLYPYGIKTEHPPDYDEMHRVAGAAIQQVIGTHGEDYRHGSITDILYTASGGSIDWYYEVNGVIHSYCYECRPNAMNGGFIVDESEIIPNAEEIWAGIVAASQTYLNQQ